MNWKWLAVAAIAAACLTRIPVAPNRLTVEGVNLAFALEQLDPLHEQPHAPAFPFFIIAMRILSAFIIRAETVLEPIFLTISILVSAACLVVVYKLSERMYSQSEARTASLLLLVNPVFWIAGAQPPIWAQLALFAVVSAFFSWKAWNGDRRSVLLGAVTLAIAAGILPEVILYMSPLWIVSAWTGTKSKSSIAAGLAIIASGVLLALDVLWVAIGNLDQLGVVLKEYPFGTALPSWRLPFDDPRLWVRSLGRFVAWNALAVSVWGWVLFSRRTASIFPTLSHRWFFVAWLAPAAIIHVIGGLSGPAQMLVYMPALCAIGARVLQTVEIKELALKVAIILSVLLFGEFVTLPDPATGSTRQGIGRVWNIAAYSIWETSLGPLRWSRELVDVSLYELHGLTRTSRPSVMVALNNPDGDLAAVSWRIASFYERNRDVWILSDSGTTRQARRTRGRNLIDLREGPAVTVTFPAGARLIWLIDPNSPFMAQLSTKVAVNRARKYVSYTDLPEGPTEFTMGNFVFKSS